MRLIETNPAPYNSRGTRDKLSFFAPMNPFIDGIVLTQKHPRDSVPDVAGYRSISYRSNGDINRDGSVMESEEVIGESFRYGWIRGSHNTAIQVKSECGLVALKGNPGRFSRFDNVFNHDLSGTISAANRIMALSGLPGFEAGEPIASARHTVRPSSDFALCTGEDGRIADYVIPDQGEFGPIYRQGARVWNIHVTKNFLTGSPANALAVLNWLDTQSVSRVKKSRLGKTTVIWGSLNYCQVEAYLKADEMMAHCKGEIEREMMRQSPIYQWCLNNGVVRIEVKAAKDYLRDRGLTYLGAWTMENVIQLFEERTELLNRVKTDIEEFDPAALPSKLYTTAAAWLRGEDVRRGMSRATFFRHASALREYGIDIAEKRNVESMPIRIKTLTIESAVAPDWYDMSPAPVQPLRVAA